MTEVSIIGAGFVGVAHAAVLSKFYPKVHLIDKNIELINSLQEGILPVASSDENLNLIFADAISKNIIKPSSDLNRISKSGLIFISISFDFSNEDSNYDNLRFLFEKIYNFLRPKALVVLETTVPPGTSEKIILPVLKKGPTEKKLRYVYSYERVMPGPNYLRSVEQLPKVYAALDESSAQTYGEHLKQVYPTGGHIKLTNLVSAETAKVFENTYRMINIALVQEFTEFAALVGANAPDILDSIRSRPTHNNIRYSGLAPGGYCLTKDPSFLMKSCELYDAKHDFSILKASIETTEKQNDAVLDFLKKNIDRSLTYKFLGLSYLSGIGDLRGSSSLFIYEKLLKLGYKVSAIDSYCQQFTNHVSSHAINITENISGAKIILATRHPEITIDILKKFDEIIDINSCLSKLEKNLLREIGIKIVQYGENV